MKKMTFLIGFGLMLFSCNENTKPEKTTTETTEQQAANTEKYDPNRGIGKFKDVQLGSIDPAKVKQGEQIYDTKCSSCHKLDNERLVGPGWKDMTQRHASAWILNFITNPDAMLDQDPELQAQMEICMVRMPNQNLTDDEALEVLEFMRKNDEKK